MTNAQIEAMLRALDFYGDIVGEMEYSLPVHDPSKLTSMIAIVRLALDGKIKDPVKTAELIAETEGWVRA